MTLSALAPQVHSFAVNGRGYALDVNSGALHALDEAAFSLLQREEIRRALASGSAAPPVPLTPAEQEAWAELTLLVRQGTLYSPLAALPDAPTAPPALKALCLHVAHDCNLRCAYCFAGEGGFGGERGLMSAEVGRRALDFLIERSGRRRRLAVDFFGGEPLLNFGAVKELIAYARRRGGEAGKEFAFTLTTNGVALRGEALEYLASSDLNVVLSLDGRPEVHDRWRRRPRGEGSHAAVLANCRDFVARRGGTNYYVRGTFTRQNLDFSADVAYLLAAGFRSLSLEPVVASEGEWALAEEDLPRLFDEYDRLAGLYLAEHRAGRPFTFYHFNLALFDAPCLARRLSGCGAGHEYLAVTPSGDLYPCHQFVGRERFRMGNVLSGDLNEELMAQFRSANVLTKPACRECWARFHCSGGCQANHHLFTGSLEEPYALGCALQRKRIECALAVQAELALDQARAQAG
ncbi:MAG: thioether cross-link-forming SCIFF peptide maturase [Bacillota bacterium]|nr:thioether cross-link-forming SCIFF peptide maturase [Bacillota bacterium]